jgi:hypothetical protein
MEEPASSGCVSKMIRLSIHMLSVIVCQSRQSCQDVNVLRLNLMINILFVCKHGLQDPIALQIEARSIAEVDECLDV